MDYKRRIEMSTKESSSIREHFTIDLANCIMAVCNVCDIKLSCGYLVLVPAP